jgi:hypothetical protein
LAILGQKSLDRFKKYNPGPNQKILPIFVSKEQRVKQSMRKTTIKLLPLNISARKG